MIGWFRKGIRTLSTLRKARMTCRAIKMALTRTSETVPFSEGRLLLGTWQGLFLWEHRHAAPMRRVVVTVIGE